MPIYGPPLEKVIALEQILDRGLQENPEGPALVSAASRWSWRELDQASRTVAVNLLGLGLRPGDRVASLMPNRTALVVYYLACLQAGLVATPLNYRYMPPEIDHALEVSKAALLVAHAERERDIAASQRAGQLPLGVVWYSSRDGKQPSLEGLQQPATSVGNLALPDPTAPAFIFFTSGSTGRPKGVTHTRATFAWVLSSMIQGFEYTAGDVVLPGSSFSHIGGIAFGLAGLAAGVKVVCPRTMDGDEILPLLRTQPPSVLWMLPAPLIALVRDHGARREDFRSIRFCTSGGDKVPAKLEREFTDLTGFPIRESYGMTEIGCATLNPPSGINKLGSVGRPGPGYHLSIRDETGAELPVGSDGRLWIKSPGNMVGYWDNALATAETIRDGWLNTGDVMKGDADGYLWFCGRKKQIIIHDGSNICPQEVEEALLAHPAVLSAGVVGVHDLMHGEIVRAYVAIRPGAAPPTRQELIRFARERVGYKAPEEVYWLEQMPLNPTGKVDRVALKRRAEAHLTGCE